MERKKIMTGVLLVAVVLIWGVIILKVVKGSRPAEKPLVENRIKEPLMNESKDFLQLNYRDPFLGEFVRIKEVKKSSQSQAKVIRKEPELPPVPDFTFKGLIGNGVEQRAMVLKNGSLHILGLGEMIGEFKVIGISPELMTVQNGKHKVEVKVR